MGDNEIIIRVKMGTQNDKVGDKMSDLVTKAHTFPERFMGEVHFAVDKNGVEGVTFDQLTHRELIAAMFSLSNLNKKLNESFHDRICIERMTG